MKRLVIKPFPVSQMDDQQAERTWNSLESAIGEIHNKNASSLSFEELYRFAYNLVLHKRGDMLYNGVRSTVASQLKGTAGVLAHTPDEQLLAALYTVWIDHISMMEMVRDLLMYMDRNYVKPKRKVPIYDCGLVIFRDEVVRDERIYGRLQALLLGNVEQERDGAVVDQLLLKETLAMLVVLGIKTRAVYARDFEAPFLAQTRRFYQREANRYLGKGVPSFLTMAATRLREETRRVVAYLHVSSEAPLRHVTEDELVIAHAETLVAMEGSGCNAMLKADRVAELRAMYILFRSVRRRSPYPLDALRSAFSAYIEAEGMLLVQTQDRGSGSGSSARERAIALIKGIIAMQRRYDALVDAAFDGDISFSTALKEAFERFVSQSRKPACCLSLYVDFLMRSGKRGGVNELGEESLDAKLCRVITVFSYVREKDVFESHYKEQLCRRLLDSKASSDDVERQMISKLQTENGYQYTAKMEGMFKDIRMARDLNAAYRSWCQSRQLVDEGEELDAEMDEVDVMMEDMGDNGSDAGEVSSSSSSAAAAAIAERGMRALGINVQVLTTGFWPSRLIRRGGAESGGGGGESSGGAAERTSSSVPPPREVAAACDAFSSFYLQKHSGRRLEWQMQMGRADLKWDLGRSRRLELNVSTYQMCILLRFNGSATQCSYDELLASTRIPEVEFKRHLTSLLTPKCRILLRKSGRKAAAKAAKEGGGGDAMEVETPRARARSGSSSSKAQPSVESGDLFRVNAKFKSKLLRVKVPLLRAQQRRAGALPAPVEQVRRLCRDCFPFFFSRFEKPQSFTHTLPIHTHKLGPTPPHRSDHRARHEGT